MYVAILGSRDISPRTFRLIRALAHSIVLKGHTIVTGGARGVDHAAILGALDADSTPVAIIPLTIDRQPLHVQPALQQCTVVEHPEWAEKGYIPAVHLRNKEIVYGVDITFIFSYHGSRGSRSYVRYASEIGRQVHVIRVPFGEGD